MMTEIIRFRSLAAVAVLALVVGHLCAAIAIPCNDAVARVLPCEAYLMSGASIPSTACCSGIQGLDQVAAESPQDRREICKCFKDTAKSFPVNLAKAQQLPQLCHVNLVVDINPNIDCESV